MQLLHTNMAAEHVWTSGAVSMWAERQSGLPHFKLLDHMTMECALICTYFNFLYIPTQVVYFISATTPGRGRKEGGRKEGGQDMQVSMWDCILIRERCKNTRYHNSTNWVNM